MATSVDDYISLVPAEHANKPNFISVLTVALQPYIDMQNLISTISAKYDLDGAAGTQLDVVGQWVGRTRYLAVPLNIFFSFDTPNLGFDQGIWYGPFEQATGIVALPDYNYRVLLKATIAANNWDGTIPGAITAWDTLFQGTQFGILIQDHNDMSMDLVLIGQPPDTITQALFTTGELDLKSAGVRLNHVLPSVYPAGVVGGTQGVPLFAFDVQDGNMAGFDTGAWSLFVSSE